MRWAAVCRQGGDRAPAGPGDGGQRRAGSDTPTNCRPAASSVRWPSPAQYVAFIDRYAMTGELRLLEQAENDMDEAFKAVEEATAGAGAGRNRPSWARYAACLFICRASSGWFRLKHESEHHGSDGDGGRPGTGRRPDEAGRRGSSPGWSLIWRRYGLYRLLRDPARGSTPSLGRPERDAFEKILAEAQGMGARPT